MATRDLSPVEMDLRISLQPYCENSPTPSTGELRAMLLQLRTRDSVAPAGLSAPWVYKCPAEVNYRKYHVLYLKFESISADGLLGHPMSTDDESFSSRKIWIRLTSFVKSTIPKQPHNPIIRCYERNNNDTVQFFQLCLLIPHKSCVCFECYQASVLFNCTSELYKLYDKSCACHMLQPLICCYCGPSSPKALVFLASSQLVMWFGNITRVLDSVRV